MPPANPLDELIARGYLDAPLVGQTGINPTPPPVVPPTPSYNDEFIPPKWLARLAIGIRYGKGATLFGPRGCGKSTAIRELATSLGADTVTLQCFANMQVDSLIGVWTVVNGQTVFVDGPLTIAFRNQNANGSFLLCEESNIAHAGVWSNVNTLTDNTKEGLRLPTGEVVAHNPYFKLILLYNEGAAYAGTRDVNAALKDRLMPVNATYPEKADECRMLINLTGASALDVDRIIDVANAIRASKVMDLSIRPLVRWIQLVANGVCNWREGFEYAIIDLLGAPEVSTSQRMVLAELARNTVDNWS